MEFNFTEEVAQSRSGKVWEVTMRILATKTVCLFPGFVLAPKKRAELQSGWLIAGMMLMAFSLGLANKGPFDLSLSWDLPSCRLLLEDRKRFVDERAKFHALALRWIWTDLL